MEEAGERGEEGDGSLRLLRPLVGVWRKLSAALNGVTVGGHVINMFLLQKKRAGLCSTILTVSCLPWVRNSLTKSPSYRGHVTHICVTKRKSVSSIESPRENLGD